MKIQIRRGSTSRPGAVKVREKSIYHCKECGNKYYSSHFLCPQCLGNVASDVPHTSLLQIVSCSTQLDEGVELFRKLADNQDYDFGKALASLPWICMMNTDPAILRHWKECLEARKFKCEILSATPPPKKRKRKALPPLYSSNAPFPHFLPASIITAVRESAKAIPLVSTRLHWIETVLLCYGILERLHKHPTGTILFYDFLFQIEQQLGEHLESFRTSRWSDSAFLKRNARLREALQSMEAEIEAVGLQVQEQL